MMISSALLAVLAALPGALGLILPGNVGRLPALGWNSWNAFACDVDATKIMTAANEIVNLGLKDAGYEYVNIDDCWSIKDSRDNITGQIIPDPTKFPTGISGVASAIHSLGLKAGIYSSAGTKTCGGYPASLGHEDLDASTFAAWGIDYLKYDNCYVPTASTDPYVACVPDSSNAADFPNGTCTADASRAPPAYDWSTSTTALRFRTMRDALARQNRTILYSLCEWGQAHVDAWGNATGSSWRTSGDITPCWGRIAELLNENSFLLHGVDFWGRGDADMLEVGNGNLTAAEARSHFAFWAVMKSPLIIGTELDRLHSEHVGVLKNGLLLAFSQDPVYGKPAMPYKWGVNADWTFNGSFPAEYWSGKSRNGVMVLALNSEGEKKEREILWREVPELKETKEKSEEKGKGKGRGEGKGKGGNAAYRVTDVWTGKELGCVEGGMKRGLVSHDTMAFVVGRKCKKTPWGWV